MDILMRHLRRLTMGLLALALLVPAPPADAGWLTRLLRHGDDALPHRTGKRLPAIDEAAVHLKTLPAAQRSRAVAVELIDEGHWRLRNAHGETFTASTPAELTRGLHVLAPLGEEAARQILLLSGNTLFKDQAKLKELPADAELRALLGRTVHAVHRRRVDGAEQYSLDVGGGVRVPVRSSAEVHELLWQLARPVDLTAIRILALEPGAPGLLKRTRPADPAPGRIAIESVDPARLPHMLGAVARSTVVISGRTEGQTLHYRPTSGPERTLSLDELRQAAATYDVALVVIESASARQPGTRNWFWQRVALSRLDGQRTPPALPDLIGRLTGGAPVEAQAITMQAQRTAFALTGLARGAGGGWTTPVSETWRDLAPEVTGTLVASGLRLDLTSRARQRELDARLVPGIPSLAQGAYLLLFFLGLSGLSVARGWWRRLWPPETHTEIPRRMRLRVARIVRGTLFLFIFMPLVAVASAPVAFVRGMWRTLAAIGAILAAPFTRRRAA